MMALISKVVKAGQVTPSCNREQSGHGIGAQPEHKSKSARQCCARPTYVVGNFNCEAGYYHAWVGGPQAEGRRSEHTSDHRGHELGHMEAANGRKDVIVKTMESTVIRESVDDSGGRASSETSSTMVLRP
jgi:hypothetical protein